MSKAGDIFLKRRLTPGQFRAVAQRRFDDAMCLLKSGVNARATGAVYMGGFVIECLLKAILLERHSNLQRPVDPARLSPQDNEVYGLLYRHELDEMLAMVPEVERKFSVIRDSQGRLVWPNFRTVCEEWSVYARYSPKQASVEDARWFMDTVSEVKEWLREL